jgi:hypothetical protein
MANVKAAMEHDLKLHQEKLKERLSEAKTDFDLAYADYKKECVMSFIKAAEVGEKVLDDYNAAMDEQDRIKQGSTVIDVVARYEKEILELKRLVTPMMEFKRREWVGLTKEEIDVADAQTWDEDHKSWGIHDFARHIEAKLKEKNT